MKKFTFRLDNANEANLLQKAMETLHSKGIVYTASLQENAHKQTVVVISAVQTKS